MKGIKSISIIGTGNVAFHLGKELAKNGIKIDFVYGRNESKTIELARSLNSFPAKHINLIDSDLILVCVSDEALNEVISQIPSNLRIAYTSGSVELSTISRKENIGVFYPLQTFSRNKEVNFFEVPFLLEADTTEFAQELFDLAWLLSRKVLFASSSERKNYHLAAVWVNNFTNHLVYQAKNILEKEQLNWELLLPLLAETVEKIKKVDPYEAQTGPARRNDQKTILTHEAMLFGLQKEIYSLLSKSITASYNKND